jgi:hypothetical protein
MDDLPVESGRIAGRSRGCDHSGMHSPLAHYLRDRHEMVYVMVCDVCGAQTAEVYREPYVPAFDPAGYARFVAAVA